jgi:predicted RNA-binding protein with PIN domain
VEPGERQPTPIDPEVLEGIAERLAGLVEELRGAVALPGGDVVEPVTPPEPRPRRPRRPVRLGHGLVEGTPEAVVALLSLPGAVALVDGWNVSMLGWADLDAVWQRRRLVDALGGLAARLGTEVHVVFDGVDEGQHPTAHGAARVRVQFTPDGVEADDRLLALVDQVDPGRPVVVVSSDRRVRDGAAARGANVVSSTELLAALG